MKIAIFHCEEIPTLFMLADAAKKVGFESFVFHYQDIRVFISNNDFDLKVGDVSLKDFDAVFCRGFWDYQQEVSMLADFCKNNKIALFDSALYTRQFISKIYDLVCFQLNKFPIPKTIFLEQGIKDEEILCKELKFPMVVKENRSRMGNKVFLINDRKKLHELLEGITADQKTLAADTYQFQEFIPADYDIRVIVLGGKVLGAIERRSADPNEFRHNVSLGGVAKKMEITPEMEKLAVKAAKVLNYELAGVDLIVNRETGKFYIIEVNRSPGFGGFIQATGIDLPLELMKFFASRCR
jgi:RimK family alpha-L-glutamate ligase